MRTIKFRGHEIEYDERSLKSWKLQRQIASAGTAAAFDAADAILVGKADEVAELLGDDVDAMGDLLQAIVTEIGGTAKN